MRGYLANKVAEEALNVRDRKRPVANEKSTLGKALSVQSSFKAS